MASVNSRQQLLTERASGAFLGLALGDAFGRPLEFARGEDVRTRPVSIEPGKFKWTDDTHMAIYLARAVLDVSGKPFDEEACEEKAQGKYDKAQAKRVGCPVCLDAATIASTMRETLDDENSKIYCAF